MGPPVRINSDPTTFGGPDDQILGNPADADGNGFLDTFENQVFDPYDDGWFAPSLPGPGPAPETLEELAVDLALGGFPTGPTTLHIGGDPWDDPDSDFFGAASTALQDGQTVQMDDILIIPPENGPSKIGGRGVFVSVGQSMGGFPVNDGCSGLLIEAFTETAQRGAQLWVSADFAPNDSFANLSQAHVLRCFPDAGG
jgi:hypothetical protein